jgi:hypothetical protein
VIIASWIVVGVLALFFVYAGGIKAVRSREGLQPTMGWVATAPMGLVRAIGVLEVLGALGLVLPPLTGIAPGLALAAAVGLGLVQIGAVVLHLRRGEGRLLGLNAALIVLLAVTVWLATVWL